VFTLELPLLGAMSAAPAAPRPTLHHELDGLQVLVVDDDGDTLSALALFLEMRGAAVRRAASVREALAAYDAMRAS
jgi:ActR/RegA family two-component response regulator